MVQMSPYVLKEKQNRVQEFFGKVKMAHTIFQSNFNQEMEIESSHTCKILYYTNRTIFISSSLCLSIVLLKCFH